MISLADWRAFIGLDYHASSVQVCVLDASGQVLGNRSLPNDVMMIVDYVHNIADGRLISGGAMEACCGAANLAEQLRAQEWDVQLAHAGVCAKMKQNPDKTDFSDAQLLADLVRVGYLPRVWLPPPEIRDLRRLVRFRTQLADQRRQVKLRIGALLREERLAAPPDAGSPWTKTWLAWVGRVTLGVHSRWVIDRHLASLKQLAAEIKDVEQRLEEATKDDPITQKLLEEKGVGLISAVTLRAEIGSFLRFRCGKQLARYCAVTPKNASSGKRQADAGLIKAGNLPLRTTLIELAHRLARYSPKWLAMKARLKQARKPGGVIAAAIANRWVRQLHWRFAQLETSLSVAA
jgi:transposase